MKPFQFSSPVTLILGAGSISRLTDQIRNRGKRALIIRGGRSLENSGHWQQITTLLRDDDILWTDYQISREPTPEDVDMITANHEIDEFDCVIAIGGGSVIDTGKAVSAMLGRHETVKAYLEKVGTKTPEKKQIPFIAIPTTAGTGSEATKNAVLSESGPDGFKASLRHDSYIPDVALIDPQLMTTCPADITAAAGMDALAQLLESYFSTNATPLTDALAVSGLQHIARSFPEVCDDRAQDLEARTDMAYAAYLSGLTLANAGLGTVHGIAGVMGGFHAMAHGRICGVLLAPVMRKTLAKLSEGSPAYAKMAQAGQILTGQRYPSKAEAAGALIAHLETLQEITGLSDFRNESFSAADLEKISNFSGNKNNPAHLTAAEIHAIVQTCCHQDND